MMMKPLSEQSVSSDASVVKKTALYNNHRMRGAKMVDFAGWQMPLQYSKVMEEHHAVREAAGLFDISHMGLIAIEGADVPTIQAFLNTLFPQDLTRLYEGKAVYTQFLNEQGGIIDDVIVYHLQIPQRFLQDLPPFLIIANAANTEKDMAWLQQQIDAQAEGAPPTLTLPRKGGGDLINRNSINAQNEGAIRIRLMTDHSLLALQGPRFADVMARVGFDSDYLPPRFHITEAQIQGAPLLIARTGYTGEDGVELIVPVDHTEHLWNLLIDLGKPNAVKPIGLAARDTLRLEAAYPLHGHDISENDTPLEAGLGWSVKLDKTVDFIGKAALLAQKAQGLPKSLVCFTLHDRVIARQHDIILKEGQPVGVVTSGSISPLFNIPIGMGYIQMGQITGPGDTIQIRIRGVDITAEIVERPFYQKI